MKDGFGKIGVLMGGPSEEREISLKSGKAVSQALARSGQDVIDIIIPEAKIEPPYKLRKKVYNLLKKIDIDVAFVALHGWFGEDGEIQEILDKLKIPYTGSGPLCCKTALNKLTSRKTFECNNIPVPKYKVLKSDYRGKPVCRQGRLDYNILPEQKFPVVVKPCNQGSSIGLNIAKDFQQLNHAVIESFRYNNTVLIEEYLGGRELTVGILGNKVLPVVEIVPEQEFYNFKAKYEDEHTKYIVPARIPHSLADLVKKISVLAYNSLNCRGMGRVDIKLDQFDSPKVLEINTIPGLTTKSLLPKAAKADGIDFYNLCEIILRYATSSSVLDRRIVHA